MQATTDNRRRAWMALLAVIAVAVGGPTLVTLINALVTGREAGSDFSAWFDHASMAFNRGLSPYLFESAKSAGIATYPSFYPPFNLVVFWPITLVPVSMALLLQWLANVASLVALLYLLTIRFEPIARSRPMPALVLVCACLSSGISNNFEQGQVNIEVSLLLTLVLMWSAERRRDVAMGALLALCVLLKFYFVLLLPLLVLRRRWRAALGAAAVLGAALLVTLVFFPWRGWGDWLDFVRQSGFGKAPHGWMVQLFSHNQSLNGYLSVLFGDSKITQVLGLSLAAGIVMATASTAWLRRRVPDEKFWPRAMASTVMATFLIAPLAWMHYFVVHLAIAAWLWSMAQAQGARRSAAIIVCLMVYVSLPWVDMMNGPVESVIRWLPIWGTIGLWLMALVPWSDATVGAEER